MESLADMRGGRRPQETSAQRCRRTQGRDDRARQCGVGTTFTDRIKQCERADEKVVSRRRQTRTKSEQAANSFCGSHDLSALVEHVGQPAFEGRDARAGNACQRLLTPGRRTSASEVARKALFRCIDRGATFEGGAGLDQPDRRRTGGPGRRMPRFALVQGQPKGVVDHDKPIADFDRLPGLQREIRRGAEMSDQCQGTVADIRLADTDEFVARAEIETAFENGFDGRARVASAELLRKHARSHDRDDDFGVGAQRHWRTTAARCGSAAGSAPSAAMAASVASALESATITPAAASVSTCALRGCGSASVPVTDATMTARRSPPARNAPRWPAGSGWPP